MTFLRAVICAAGLTLLTACQTNDLKEPPVPLGDFALGLNIVITDNIQMVPISRAATPEAWKASMTKAVFDRFDRYEGTKAYNFGISVDAYALAPPGVPLVLSPKSVLAITVTLWDDAAGEKLNPEAKQFIVFERASAETVVGSGLTKTKEQQMETLTYNAAKAIEQWMLENRQWFGPATVAGTALPAAPLAAPAVASLPSPAQPATDKSATAKNAGTSPSVGATLP